MHAAAAFGRSPSFGRAVYGSQRLMCHKTEVGYTLDEIGVLHQGGDFHAGSMCRNTSLDTADQNLLSCRVTPLDEFASCRVTPLDEFAGVAGASPISFLESMTWTGLAWASPILS